MPEPASALSAWESFYVIVGSSGGALIGLQFVVMALIADTGKRASTASINAFGTPTVLQFVSALVLSAIMSAPWPSSIALSLALGICSLVGLGYAAVAVVRA